MKIQVLIASLILLSVNAQAKEWYEEKGDLHGKTMTEWCKAEDKNKLATAGDIVAKAYQENLFKPEIMQAIKQHKMPGIKIMAEELVTALNGTCEGKKATEGTATQQVGQMSAMAMMLMEWFGK